MTDNTTTKLDNDNLIKRPKHKGRRPPTRHNKEAESNKPQAPADESVVLAISPVKPDTTQPVDTGTLDHAPKTLTPPVVAKPTKGKKKVPSTRSTKNAFLAGIGFLAAVGTAIASSYAKIAVFLATLSMPAVVGVVALGVLAIAAVTYGLIKAYQSNSHTAFDQAKDKKDTNSTQKVFSKTGGAGPVICAEVDSTITKTREAPLVAVTSPSLVESVEAPSRRM